MSAGRLVQRLLILVIALVALTVHFLEIVRPAYLNWGATEVERLKALPGDEIVQRPGVQETRAITIAAPIDTVWSWLAQIGQDRGGFYSFDLLENIVGCEMPTVDILRPAQQSWRLGDKLWMYPSEKAGGAGFATLQAFDPGHVLGFATRMVGTTLDEPADGSWTYVLEPIDATNTRLLIRGRGSPRHTMLGAAFDWIIFEPVHFAMERRMMIGLKELAETGARSRRLNHLHVLLWTISFGTIVWAAVLVIRRLSWMLPLAAFIAAAAVFEILTLRQPPVAAGVLWLAGVGVLLHAPRWRQQP